MKRRNTRVIPEYFLAGSLSRLRRRPRKSAEFRGQLRINGLESGVGRAGEFHWNVEKQGRDGSKVVDRSFATVTSVLITCQRGTSVDVLWPGRMLATGTIPGSAGGPWLEYFIDKVVRNQAGREAGFTLLLGTSKREEKRRERTVRVGEKMDGRWDRKGKKIDR